jgi:hypothetical protein
MDNEYIQAFECVEDFVELLWDNFKVSKRATPLSLYRRIVTHIRNKKTESLNEDGVNKALSGFRQFLCTFETQIMENNMDKIPKGTVIKYGNRSDICLEIQKYIYLCNKNSDEDTRDLIREHLITISAILEPNKDKMNEKLAQLGHLENSTNLENLEGLDLNIDTSTREGQFIGNIIERTKNSVGESEDGRPPDMMGLLQSGIIQDMFQGMQGVASGEMDMMKMVGTMQNALGALASASQPQGTPGPPGTHPELRTQRFSSDQVEEIKDVKDAPNDIEIVEDN